MGRGLLSKEMSTEAKTAEEEFDVMSCPKFVKVGTQRDTAEAFAEYRVFRIRERKDVARAAVSGTLNITGISVILGGFKTRGMKLQLESTWGVTVRLKSVGKKKDRNGNPVGARSKISSRWACLEEMW
eukprot:g19741.t1